jgi:glycosyltransferase involved in cell wall biosynthesis
VTKLSVIIPHMNQPEFLLRCLTSLAKQVDAFPGTEVIVVDNGSRELPTKIIAAYSWARLEQESAKGPGPARNKGIQVAKGDILAFIDADCLAHPGWLASIVRAFTSTHPDAQIIGGEVLIAYVDEANITMLEAYESVFGYRQQDYIEQQHFSGTGCLAMRKHVFAKVGPFAGIGVAEDRDWGQRAHQAGFKTYFIHDMIVYHPARKSFDELCVKWDRHIVHDFNERADGLFGRIKWLVLIAVVAGSGFVDIVRRVFFSPHLKGLKQRVMASVMLIRVRFYRATQMVRMLFVRNKADPKWNR